MSSPKKGFLIVLSGPSGAGKDSILSKILKDRKDLKLSVSHTTRLPRKGEVQGKDYFFVAKEDFKTMVSNGQMLEYACYCGNYYGTSLLQVSKEINDGNSVILEIEVQGAQQIINNYKNVLSIFVLPPSLKVLRERLESRGTDSKEVIDMRVERARQEIKMAENYEYIVVNDDLDRCAKDILKIIDSRCMKSCNMKYLIDEVIKND